MRAGDQRLGMWPEVLHACTGDRAGGEESGPARVGWGGRARRAWAPHSHRT